MFYKNNSFIKKNLTIFIAVFFLLFVFHQKVFSETVADIQNKIDATNAQKVELEKEIASYESQLKNIGQQATSLTSALKSLDATINKNTLNIKLTQNNINTTKLQIQQLSIQIDKNTGVINQDSAAMGNLISEVNQADSNTLIENLLAYNNISDFWNELENMYQLQNQLREKVSETKDAKKTLEDNKAATEDKQKQLLALESSLQDQNSVLQVTKSAKATLLAQTKNKESNYEAILAQKKALSASLDQELTQFQSQLHLPINLSGIPSAGTIIFQWPLYLAIRITQYFGNTEFSKTTTAYNGQGHDGVDFGAPIGTPVYAALGGTVAGTGNTDIVCPGASFGQWIFINHSNGLSTMYAHLSLIKVQAGQQVFAGEIIGYTGLTGFTTGPHLHFGVYVTSGSEITSYKSKVCKGTYTMPVADLAAYLDPLQYLPQL